MKSRRYLNRQSKEWIFLTTGPLHLFWTAGVYYLYELNKRYRILLIVDKSYFCDPNFERAIEFLKTVEVFVVPDGFVSRQKAYLTDFRRLIETYRPAIIFHHDSVYVSMMYLHHWARQLAPRAIRISYLNGMTSLASFEEMAKPVLAFEINAIANKRHIPLWLAGLVHQAGALLRFNLEYRLLPWLLIRWNFRAPLNVYNFAPTGNSWVSHFDYFLVSDELDKASIRRIFGSERGVLSLRHPLETVGSEFIDTFYQCVERNVICVFPSYGHIDKLKIERNLTDEAIVTMLSNTWADLILALTEKFPEFELKWKLHPMQVNDSIWLRVQECIKERFPQCVVVHPSESAQALINGSNVVVGEVSSVLWWASHFESKVAISVDLFGLDSMDEMKHREGMLYFNSLDEFRTRPASEFAGHAVHHQGRNRQKASLTEFLSQLLPQVEQSVKE